LRIDSRISEGCREGREVDVEESETGSSHPLPEAKDVAEREPVAPAVVALKGNGRAGNSCVGNEDAGRVDTANRGQRR